MVAASSQFVTMGNVYDFTRAQSWSVSCWMRTTTAGSILLGKQATAGNFPGWGLFQVSGAIRWRIGFGGFNQSATVDAAIASLQDGNWHHILATYNGTSLVSGMVVYHNGVSVTLSTVDNDLAGLITNASPF